MSAFSYRRLAHGFLLVVAGLLALPQSSLAACSRKDFADAVDQSGQALRALNGEFQPKLKERMRRFKEVKGLSDAAYEDAALDSIQDARLAELDSQSGELILKVDTLGRVAEDVNPECSRLSDIKAASAELQVVVRTKSEYMLTALDAKIRETESRKPTQPKTAAAPADAAGKTATGAMPETKPEPGANSKAAEAKPQPPKTWSTTTVEDDSYHPPAAGEQKAPQTAAPVMTPGEEGYTIEEIQDATRGFFGSISTNLAGVLEHAFQTSGRPTGYVLGTEGGGAFLAGLRYGNGTLYMRHQAETRKVYWHGPSLGYDVGAEGGRTLFLIYRLSSPDALYRSYAGIDGSAYVIGGVGITFLKGGDVIMAPIRSGLGLRLGANIGYVRFTTSPTWNPF
jgi:hypothetical protein